ncbi:transcriptional regulator [Modestobacter sp. VKM Ac-2986]|uniref:PaaX family transcriptional regulator n=1 Tax=Modestobacter sp. VKM Ac-2986 TaxID=3004140 RepID=UPI0022AADFD5|nr:PaaX family transcriptional regulator C-terminal domain-containing protein [Modestobacter sp. VKM Ac-2986]MCZ2828852.1 transcriptional regulator [Modestobacter sp. VKM Ac-2986]
MTGLPAAEELDGHRPQTLLFTFLGRHVLGSPTGVASSVLIAVLEQLGVSQQAARSTITRMVKRGHLERHRIGRRAYFTVSPSLSGVLTEGERRIFGPPSPVDREGTWTLLSFSIPESERAARHSLRTALAYRGFGLLRSGLWIASGEVDVLPTLDRMGLRDRVDVFHARPADPHRLVGSVQDVWDLDAVAEGYRRFLDVWGGRRPQPGRYLANDVALISAWQQVQVADPGLPASHLPPDWPAAAATELFLERSARWRAAADAEFGELLRDDGAESVAPAATVAPLPGRPAARLVRGTGDR